jgi:DNA-binding CsgD family transcriptional regulator
MKEAMILNPEPNPSVDQIRRERMNIVIGTDMAWATWDQFGIDTGNRYDLPGVEHELRIFHKIDGHWKIAGFVIMQQNIDLARFPLVEIDTGLRIIWKNDEATARLPFFPELVIRGGRLTARDKGSDAKLRETVSRAFRTNDELLARIAAEDRVTAVALGEDDYGVRRYCWVIAEDSKVLVSFNDEEISDRKLSLAEKVYRLSPTQAQLVNLIVRGNDISDAASSLGVTINTVRTHLQRIYDKTGARSLPALVRAILNMEPPIS